MISVTLYYAMQDLFKTIFINYSKNINQKFFSVLFICL